MHPTLDKTKLLDLIRAEYAFASRTLLSISAPQMKIAGVCGHWSVKDIMAHLTSWENRTLRWLDDAEKGVPLKAPEEGFGWHEFDALNEKYYQISKRQPRLYIGKHFLQTQGIILAKVESMTDEELAGGGKYAGMFSDSPMDAIAANTFQHYQTHLSQIRMWFNTLS